MKVKDNLKADTLIILIIIGNVGEMKVRTDVNQLTDSIYLKQEVIICGTLVFLL